MSVKDGRQTGRLLGRDAINEEFGLAAVQGSFNRLPEGGLGITSHRDHSKENLAATLPLDPCAEAKCRVFTLCTDDGEIRDDRRAPCCIQGQKAEAHKDEEVPTFGAVSVFLHCARPRVRMSGSGMIQAR